MTMGGVGAAAQAGAEGLRDAADQDTTWAGSDKKEGLVNDAGSETQAMIAEDPDAPHEAIEQDTREAPEVLHGGRS